MHLRRHAVRLMILWAIVGIVVAAFALNGVRMNLLTKDVHQLAKNWEAHEDLPPYYGMLSNIGALIWCSAVAAMLFASFQLAGGVEASEARKCLRWCALLTFLVMIDDFFMVHEYVFPRVLGLSERLPVAVYCIGFIAFFVRYAKFLRNNTHWQVLALAVGLLVVSEAADVTSTVGIDVEDGFKIAGLIAYSYYWVHASWLLTTGAKTETATQLVESSSCERPT